MQSASAGTARADHYRVPDLKGNPAEDSVSPDSVMYAVGAQSFASSRLSGGMQVDARSPVLSRTQSSESSNLDNNTRPRKTVRFSEVVRVQVVERYLDNRAYNPVWFELFLEEMKLDDLQKTANGLRSVESALPSSVVGNLARQLAPLAAIIAVSLFLGAQGQNKPQDK